MKLRARIREKFVEFLGEPSALINNDILVEALAWARERGRDTVAFPGHGIYTVRACVDCGVPEAGGPTRCVPCATAMHSYSGSTAETIQRAAERAEKLSVALAQRAIELQELARSAPHAEPVEFEEYVSEIRTYDPARVVVYYNGVEVRGVALESAEPLSPGDPITLNLDGRAVRASEGARIVGHVTEGQLTPDGMCTVRLTFDES